MIKEFSIGFSRTVNLGNYESCRIEASVTSVVSDDKDELGVAAAEAQIELRKLLEDTFRAQHEMRKKTA
jgi:hypothetical protein